MEQKEFGDLKTSSGGGSKAPKGWKINEKAKHTIVIYKNKTVVKTFGLNKLDKKSVAEVTAAVAKVLGS